MHVNTNMSIWGVPFLFGLVNHFDKLSQHIANVFECFLIPVILGQRVETNPYQGPGKFFQVRVEAFHPVPEEETDRVEEIGPSFQHAVSILQQSENDCEEAFSTSLYVKVSLGFPFGRDPVERNYFSGLDFREFFDEDVGFHVFYECIDP